MNQNNEKIEKILEKRSNDSIDDLITYVLFRIQSPIEDYYWAIDFLRDMYPKKKDIRLAIIGAYLSSTWLSVDTNPFIPLLNEHILTVDNQTKAIIYYLYAYDLYLKCDDNYPKQYSDALRKSVFYSKRFVLNYVRLAEVAEKKEAILLLDLAIKNVEKVWTEEELLQEPEESFITYESFIDEFILGVDISSFEYESLLKKRKSLRYKLF